MGRLLRKISRFFENELGARYNPLLRSSIACGAIVDIDGRIDIDIVASLEDFGVKLPEIKIGSARLPNLRRFRNVELKGDLESEVPAAVPVDGRIGAAMRSVSHITMSFGDATTNWMSVKDLDDAIYDQLLPDDRDSERLETWLRDRDLHIIQAVYSATMAVNFHREGGGRANIRAKVPDVAGGGAGVRWKWGSDAKLETEEPVLFGFETMRWSRSKKRLVSTS